MKYTEQILFTIELNCGICGTNVGTHSAPQILTPEQLGFVDIRCDQCNIDHGTFKELTEKYEKETGGTAEEAEIFVKENKKKSDFDKALENVIII